MRTDYRANRRNAHRELRRQRKTEARNRGMTLREYEELEKAEARRVLGLWARSGGKVNILKGDSDGSAGPAAGV